MRAVHSGAATACPSFRSRPWWGPGAAGSAGCPGVPAGRSAALVGCAGACGFAPRLRVRRSGSACQSTEHCGGSSGLWGHSLEWPATRSPHPEPPAGFRRKPSRARPGCQERDARDCRDPRQWGDWVHERSLRDAPHPKPSIPGAIRSFPKPLPSQRGRPAGMAKSWSVGEEVGDA